MLSRFFTLEEVIVSTMAIRGELLNFGNSLKNYIRNFSKKNHVILSKVLVLCKIMIKFVNKTLNPDNSTSHPPEIY